ncbi:MAG: response regulator [Nitrospirae bacterium]|nr:response regulator [Nitrospirota bacterium]
MSKGRIMVVEDEGIIAEDIKSSLINMGYDVPAVVSSGKEAIRKAIEIRPDLVLMDVVLRDKIDGVDAAGVIRSGSDIPVIYLIAYADGEILKRAKVTEPYGYIINTRPG